MTLRMEKLRRRDLRQLLRIESKVFPEPWSVAVFNSELALRTLGEHTFNRYVEIKRREWEEYRTQVTRWELDRYLPIL